jgi:hypothetical protein
MVLLFRNGLIAARKWAAPTINAASPRNSEIRTECCLIEHAMRLEDQLGDLVRIHRGSCILTSGSIAVPGLLPYPGSPY